MFTLEDEVILDQVERILHSNELRGAEVLRRLLKFLAEKPLSGESDELKEYIVATDGLGKPASYDPRHNSAVRIQVGRLRQKLADYYRAEGRDDPIIIDVPKGRIKLRCEQRPAPASPPVAALDAPPPFPFVPRVDRDTKGLGKGLSAIPFATVVWLGIVLATALGMYFWMKPRSAPPNGSSVAAWTPEMQDLWGPFVASKRPLIVAIEDPLFVRLLSGAGIYHGDRSINRWEDASKSPAVAALRGVLHNPDIQPSQYYTAFGEADASFLIAKLLGPREQNFSLIKSSNLSWQQLADNNVLLVGRQNVFFDERLLAMPIELQFLPRPGGIRDLHPNAGEPSFFADQYSTASSKDGFAYALISHLPGPLASGDVESFTSNRSAGYVAAVKAFADPTFAAVLAQKLRQAAGGANAAVLSGFAEN